MGPKKRGRGVPRLRADPLAVAVFLCLFLTDRAATAWALLLAVAVHECGHLLVARALRIPLAGMRVGLFGARIEARSGLLSYGSEWLLAAGGPFAGFLLAAGAAPLRGVPFFAALGAASFLLSALNLLPVGTFDGGRMTFCLLAPLFGDAAAERVLKVCSFGILFLLWSGSVYLLLRHGGGISWLAFSAGLLGGFFSDGSDRAA